MEAGPIAGDRSVFASIVLASVLWTIMFVLRPLNFWIMMSLSTSLLAIISFYFGRPLLPRDELTSRNVVLGILLAGVLYAVFWIGNEALKILAEVLPNLLSNRSENLSAIYNQDGRMPLHLVGILLFFPIGFGEEIFWRGFVQRRLSRRWNPVNGFMLTTFLYTILHLPTGNPVLILAALTCGLFWGGLYWATGALVPVLVSHMLWDPAIFVLWPIK
jgi:membrane protease YdiL (CAAX protease family)